MLQVFKCVLVKESKPLPWDRRKPYSEPEAVSKLLSQYLEGADRENMVVLALDSQNHVIGVNTVSVGILDSTLVHPREVFKFAIMANAASIILGHNHPSGDVKPSAEDIAATKRFTQAGTLIGIELLDHIIVGEDGFTSLRQKGYIS